MMMKSPTLSFWKVSLSWIDMLVCFIISALATVGFAAVSPLGHKLLASPWLDFADFLVYLLIGYWGYFVVTLAICLFTARWLRWVRQKKSLQDIQDGTSDQYEKDIQ